MQTFLYVFLHVAFGVLAGVVFSYLRNEQASKASRWLAYLVGIGVCLAIAAAIGEASKKWQISAFFDWVGVIAMPLSFFGIIVFNKIVRSTCK